MKILIVGKGAREHALAAKIAEDNRVEEVIVYPGNPGMNKTQKIKLLDGFELEEFFKYISDINLEFALIGPEDYIINGFADKLRDLNIKVISPSIDAAQLESSKIFSKKIMNKYKIPTAYSCEVYSYNEAINAIDAIYANSPVVIKLSGLHAGKGVYIAKNAVDAKKKLFEWTGFLSDGVLLEEFLEGFEVSLFYLCHAGIPLFLGEATDHKRIYDNDEGDNTGGMGCFSPNPMLTHSDRDFIKKEVAMKTLNGMKAEGVHFEGVLFIGVMMTKSGPRVLEYNVRFGDPETQTILPRIKSGLLDSMILMANNKSEDFKKLEIKFHDLKSVHVVKATSGYPHHPKLNDEVIISENLDKHFYFAGVKKENGKIITSGGRVCGLTALAKSFSEARELCYGNLNQISFKGEHFRKDIGAKAI